MRWFVAALVGFLAVIALGAVISDAVFYPLLFVAAVIFGLGLSSIRQHPQS